MFKTLSGLTDNAFLRVSADTKTCGSPLYACHLYGGLYYTKFRVKVNQKTAKKVLFFSCNMEKICYTAFYTFFGYPGGGWIAKSGTFSTRPSELP
jgi:hypothetical protein